MRWAATYDASGIGQCRTGCPLFEDNPFLGCRGIRFSLEHPEIFMIQLRAMLRANAGLGCWLPGLAVIITGMVGERRRPGMVARRLIWPDDVVTGFAPAWRANPRALRQHPGSR